jgi:hypothetical protein
VKHPPSPLSSSFGSKEGLPSGSVSSSFMSQDQPTPTTDDGTDSPLRYYTRPHLPTFHFHPFYNITCQFRNKPVRRIDHGKYCLGLQEIAEGESGSVYAARLTDKNIHKLKLTLLIKARDT